MDQDSIDRIRSTTFPAARRGYDRREVDRFLERIAEWLESGGGDDTRADLVRRELERIAEKTGRILTDAHDAGEQLRAEAQAEAERLMAEAATDAEETRAAADRYASGVRAEADAHSERSRIETDEYAGEARADADAYAARVHNEADVRAADIVEAAEADARAINEEGERRRRAVEDEIAELEERRAIVIAEMRRLSSQLAGSATGHAAPDEPADDAEANGEVADGEAEADRQAAATRSRPDA